MTPEPRFVTSNGASFTSVRVMVTVSLLRLVPSPTSTVSVNTEQRLASDCRTNVELTCEASAPCA